MNLFRNLAPARWRTKRYLRFGVDYGLKLSSLHLFPLCCLVTERECGDQWGRKLDCWPWSASCPAWLEETLEKSVICTVMEGFKGGPYCLLWQELLTCELPAIPAACNVYSTCTQNTVIRASRARSLSNPCRLSGGEHVLSDTKINGICILLWHLAFFFRLFFHWIYLAHNQGFFFVHTVYAELMLVWLGVHVLLSMNNGGKRRYMWHFPPSRYWNISKILICIVYSMFIFNRCETFILGEIVFIFNFRLVLISYDAVLCIS